MQITAIGYKYNSYLCNELTKRIRDMKTRFPQKFALPIILSLLTMYSCTEKNYYNPNYTGGQKEKPLDLDVPANMDWNLLSTTKITVNVDDDYNGEYYYTVEIYDAEPLFSENAKILAAGIAKKGEVFTAAIETKAEQTTLFIKRTDPRGRAVVGSVEIQKGDANISYNFASTSENTAPVTRSMASTRSGNITVPTYSKVPDGAIEVTGYTTNQDWFEGGKNYCITKDYEGGIYHNGGDKCKLFVSGTWTIPKNTNKAYWQHAINTGLEVIILPGGKIIDKGEKISFNGTAGLTVMQGGRFECEELKLTNTSIIYNLGIIEAEYLILQSGVTLYNDCSIEVEDNINANASNISIYMNKGSIKAEDITFNNVTIHMNDGCLIEADERIDNMSNTQYIATGNVSLVTAEKINCSSSVIYNGKLVIESKEHSEGDKYWSPYKLKNGAKIAKQGQANIVIETCNGESHEPDTGKEPSNPDFPIEIITSTDYIFAMEDQWPTYGDYDMNDVVVGISPDISNYIDPRTQTKVKQVKFGVRLLAVGALKQIAAAIQLENITPKQIESVEYDSKSIQELLGGSFYIDGNGVEINQKKAVIPLFENANKLLGNNFVNVGQGEIVKSVEFNIVVNFKDNANVKPEDLGHKALNFFIIPDLAKLQSKQRRPEIHLGGYAPTALANPDLFDESNPNARKYISTDNLVWGLMIPTYEWKCPDEGVNITKAYEHFAEWVTSGGKLHPDWYK